MTSAPHSEPHSEPHPELHLPSFDELAARATVVALPMRVPFRGVRLREAMVFDAPTAWSEWAPFVEYEAAEAATWLRSAITFGWGPDASVRDSVAVNATIPAVDVSRDPEVIDALMQRYPGCTTVKIKVAEKGQTAQHDLNRIAAVRQWFTDNAGGAAATAHPAIRLDANGGWSVDEAVDVVTAAASNQGIDYVEQPCQSIDELAEVRRRLMRAGVFARVAADEAIRKSGDPHAAVREVVDAGACDVVVLKVPPLGGVDVLLDVAADVARNGVAVTVSSALDTAVGLGAGLRAAASLPTLTDDDGMLVEPQPAGLATGSLFTHDLARREIIDGRMDARAVTPDPAALDDLEVTGARRDWWLNRLKECRHELHRRGM